MALRIGYWAASEQYPPGRLLEFVERAEREGFKTTVTSDHFHPWFHTGAEAGFSWVWMAAAAERTRRMILGTGVTAPLFRYHPALIAQAFATLGALYPGRIFLSMGTGEAMNETPLGFPWPKFKERAGRLEEAVRIIRGLWGGDFFTFEGEYFQTREAKLYTRSPQPIPLYLSASGPTAGRLAGRYADGVLTIPLGEEHFRTVLIPAVETGAQEAGRKAEDLDWMIEMKVSYDPDEERALEACKIWGATLVPGILNQPIADPRELEERGKEIQEEAFRKGWLISPDPEDHIQQVEAYAKLGFRSIQIHSSSPDEEAFLRFYGREVLPYLREEHRE
jgi:coenzyme F420-dependent glucose-6-phosphate dehydrogenase